ncbi:MAG TPA: hypothetical protein VFC03_14440 [Acidimicrobiales bacterium]|nr:hypothetical protein [Acidimicrobiales bacterium]
MSTGISFAVSADAPRDVPPELLPARHFGGRLNGAVYGLGLIEEVPAEIAALLEDKWGRPPTIIEVAAVHQMPTSRRNEALAATGLRLGALYLVDRSLRHEQ